MTYRLVYKCALCGARVVIGGPVDAPKMYGAGGAMETTFHLTHDCPDGSIGALTPAGFAPSVDVQQSTPVKKSTRRPRKVADK